MDAQNQVLDCFPFAEARQTPPLRLYGACSSTLTREWAIFTGPDHDAEELGRGRSEALAWADAADQLEIVAA